MENLPETGFYVKPHGGVPTLFHGGAPFAAAAYMTYLTPYARYEDFARAGYWLFSFPALCAGKWISKAHGLRPFCKGIFDGETPDFSAFDKDVRRILSACPEAYLVPRVNLSMPDRWLTAHPDCLDGAGERESLLTDAYAAEAERMLRALIAHVNESGYRERIAGYHLAGGNTEEWFHFDMNAGRAPAAETGFMAYLQKHYPGMPYAGLPDLGALNGPGPCHNDAYLEKYLEFSNVRVAETVVRLAAAAKEAAGAGVLVGAFFGYVLEVTAPTWGVHALNVLLESDAVDFISSPNSYIGVRAPDLDWTEMYPADSVRFHGKLCLQECDIRTHLTKPLGQAAPEYDPAGVLDAPVWRGLKDRGTAVGQLRKAFCRQLIKGNGFWWFDMWGGWYRDAAVMEEMKRFLVICEEALSLPRRGSVAEAAVFTDGTASWRMTQCPRRGIVHAQRAALGHTGAPYDIYDISDFPAVCARYKAAVFLTGTRTCALDAALAECGRRGIVYLTDIDRDAPFSVDELVSLYDAAGVHRYISPGDIVYVNGGYFAVYAVSGGEKTFRFPRETVLEDLLDGANPLRGKEITVTVREGETKLFRLSGE